MVKKVIQNLALLWLLLCCLASTVYAESDYTINGVTVRYDDFTSRPGACRVYAGKLYQKIWGVGFSSDFYDTDNMLRNLPMEELVLTEEHLKEYIGQAALGSAFRVSSARYVHRNDGGAGHTQLIVQKDEEGFTVLEGGLTERPYYREHYYTWSEFVGTHWLGGKYGYIKYIKWPGAPEYDPDYDAQAPVISGFKIETAPDYSGFTALFDVYDDVRVEQAYLVVWPQGLSQSEGVTISCAWDGSTAAAKFSADFFGGEVRNFYAKCVAVDGMGNSSRVQAQLVGLYPLNLRFRGYCKAVRDDTPLYSAPDTAVNGLDTQVSTVGRGSFLQVCGFYQKDDGPRWYQLADGLWVREQDVRYHTFLSFLDWILNDARNKDTVWVDDQLLFLGE